MITRRAMTLLELLLALTILGATAGLCVGLIGPMSADQRRSRAESALRDAVARAGLLARRCGGAELRLGAALECVARAGDDDGTIALRIGLPPGWSAHALAADGDAGADAVPFDAHGCAPDARFALRGGRGEVVVMELLGLSGQVRALRDGEGAAP